MSYTPPDHAAAAPSREESVAYTPPTHTAAAVSFEPGLEGRVRLRLHVRVCPGGAIALPLLLETGPGGSAGLALRIKTVDLVRCALRVRAGAPGLASLSVRVSTADGGTAGLPLQCQVVPVGPFSLPLRALYGPLGLVAVGLAVQTLPAGVVDGSDPLGDGSQVPSPAPGYGTAQGTVWRPVVTLMGGNIADQLIGNIEIEAEEGAARIATLSLKRAPGETLVLPAWTGAAIVIYMARRTVTGELEQLPLFNGIVDAPEFDMSTRVITLTCTDDLQGVISALSDTQIADLVEASQWSPHVFDPATSTGWQLLQDRVSTVPGVVDLDVWRAPVFSSIYGGPNVITYTGDDVEDGSLSSGFARAGELVNQFVIKFTYRYQRLNIARQSVGYDVLTATGLSLFEFAIGAANGEFTWMTRSAAESAFSSAGGNPEGMSFEELKSGKVFSPDNPNDFLVISANPNVGTGFSGNISTPYSFWIDEEYQITVNAPVAVKATGRRERTLEGSLEAVSQQADIWEERSYLESASSGASPSRLDPIIVGRTDATTTPETSRPAAEAAIKCLIAMSQAEIQKSHRGNSLTFTVPLNAALDRRHRVKLVMNGVSATGKVRGLRHVMEPDTGRAVTEITLAISSLLGTGVTHPAPAPLEIAQPTPAQKPSEGISLSASAEYTHDNSTANQITVGLRPVPTEETANKVIVLSQHIIAPLVEDLFEISS